MHLSLQGHVKWLIKNLFYTKAAVCYVGMNIDGLNHLINFLAEDLWYLLCQYVFSIRILYEPIQDKNAIKVADDLINSYVRLSSQIYGKEVADYTVHAHLHLPKQVMLHGPLHCHSQFVFEVNYYFIYSR